MSIETKFGEVKDCENPNCDNRFKVVKKNLKHYFCKSCEKRPELYLTNTKAKTKYFIDKYKIQSVKLLTTKLGRYWVLDVPRLNVKNDPLRITNPDILKEYLIEARDRIDRDIKSLENK